MVVRADGLATPVLIKSVGVSTCRHSTWLVELSEGAECVCRKPLFSQYESAIMTSLVNTRQLRTILRSMVMSGSAALLLLPMAARGQVTPSTTGGATPVISEDTDKTGTAAILSIKGMLTDVTVESLKRRIEQARTQGAKVIVFDMDTPGGLVTSSIAIADLIRELSDIKTVAWVNPNAHSGGSLVAVACDEIVMARSSRIGDSQVIMGGPIGAAAIPEELQPKAYTPVLADFRASARVNGYSQILCEAFVLPDREVWWVENAKTGERKFVFRDEKLRLFGETDDETNAKKDADEDEKDEKDESKKPSETAPAKPVDSTTDWKLVETYHDPILEIEVDTIQPVVRDDQLLEMSAGEAYAYGFSKGIVATDDEIRERYMVGSVFRIDANWSESLAYWLTSMYVRGFLMLIILLGAYVEFHTPGVGVPGLAALICLAIFVGAPYLTGLANIWEVVMILVGITLLMLELFVIPGFGVAGISGIALVLIGLLATFVPEEPGRWFPLFTPDMQGTMEYLRRGLKTLVAAMAMSIVGMVLLSKYLPKTPIFRRFVPANPTPSQVLMEDPYRGAARIGDLGATEGPLRPAGKAIFGSVLVDVVTQGEYLEPGTRVEVVERHGNRIVVRAVT